MNIKPPSGLRQLFNIDAAELSNKSESLNNVQPKTAVFIRDNFHQQQSINEITSKLDHYFITLISNTRFDYDSRFYTAIDIILKESGVLNIEQDLNTGISQRQLRRLFKFYIGDSAKTFAKVVRFQNIFHAKPFSPSLRQNKLFLDAGYYDQAHFIKDFKNFYGVTADKAFRR